MNLVELGVLPPEDIRYPVFLSRRTMEFLGANIIHRVNDKKYSDDERELLRTIWDRFELHNRANGTYHSGKIAFSHSDISFIGTILKVAVDHDIGLQNGEGFCRNAANAFLELNGRFILFGGEDNTELRDYFEHAREIVGS